MSVRRRGIAIQQKVALLSADPVDLGAQSDLIGAPEPMSTEAVLAAPNGGYLRTRVDLHESLSVP